MLKKADFDREFCAELRDYDGPKDMGSGYILWQKIQERRPDLGYCRCSACRSNPWNHVMPLLQRCGFREESN